MNRDILMVRVELLLKPSLQAHVWSKALLLVRKADFSLLPLVGRQIIPNPEPLNFLSPDTSTCLSFPFLLSGRDLVDFLTSSIVTLFLPARFTGKKWFRLGVYDISFR